MVQMSPLRQRMNEYLTGSNPGLATTDTDIR